MWHIFGTQQKLNENTDELIFWGLSKEVCPVKVKSSKSLSGHNRRVNFLFFLNLVVNMQNLEARNGKGIFLKYIAI